MTASRTFRAPGRVNLIGEHTDYNLGFVLPIALDLATYAEARPAADGVCHVWSDQRQESFSWRVEETAGLRPRGHWSDYIAGVAVQLATRGVDLRPLHLRIRSEVPEGSGLSSSAALEVSVALALLQGRAFDRLELAQLCQRAETEFVGMPCGIMDQFVAVFGEEGAAIRIDCRSLEYRAVALPSDPEIIAINSLVKHELGASAYRTRVAECRMAVEALQREYPAIRSLRDATPAQVAKTAMPPVVRNRARHIVTENQRVEHFVEAAMARNPRAMGRLFVESHESMRDDYEISCEEIDFLVNAAVETDGCYGARMTGGGFGGCTVNLVEASAVASFRQTLRERYQSRFGIEPVSFRCKPGSGAGEIQGIS